MKKLYTLGAVAMILLTGCSYKNEAIELSSYKGQYLGKTTQDQRPVTLVSVTDARENKTSVGYVLANDVETDKLYSYVNFADRYKDALTTALGMAKFNLVQNPADAVETISVKIKDIQLIYNDTKKFDENLHGKVVVEVTLKKGDKTLVQTFTQAQGKWIQPSYTSKDIEPLLDTIFTDSVNDIVSKLTDQTSI
ncbi:MAG: YajG family lipoprotein [Sulfuricurvum sp.]